MFASGELSTVLAGTENIASGYSSVISSGISNKADSAFSMVLGGKKIYQMARSHLL